MSLGRAAAATTGVRVGALAYAFFEAPKNAKAFPDFPALTAIFPASRLSVVPIEGLSRTRYATTVAVRESGRHRRGNQVASLRHRTVIEQRERLNTHRCQDEIYSSILPRTAQSAAALLVLSGAHSNHLGVVTSPDAGGFVTGVTGLTCTAIAISAPQGGV